MDPTASTRARLAGAHAAYLDRQPTDSRRLAVEAILGAIGDLADPLAVATVISAHPDVRGMSRARFEALCARVAKQVRALDVRLSFPDEREVER
jgi:hypothetical protein